MYQALTVLSEAVLLISAKIIVFFFNLENMGIATWHEIQENTSIITRVLFCILEAVYLFNSCSLFLPYTYLITCIVLIFENKNF